jgi:hypothetical protein
MASSYQNLAMKCQATQMTAAVAAKESSIQRIHTPTIAFQNLSLMASSLKV